MRIGIIAIPGSSVDANTVQAVERSGMSVEYLSGDSSYEELLACQGYVVTADHLEAYVSAEVLSAMQFVIDTLKRQTEAGKPVLGIGYGAHVLIDAGLVPYLENYKVGMGMVLSQVEDLNSLTNIRLSPDYQRNAFTRHLMPSSRLTLPLASPSRFDMTFALLTEIKAQGLDVFLYDVDMTIDVASIAGLSNKAGNVLATIFHPAGHATGDAIFSSMKEYIEEGRFQPVWPLSYYPRKK